MKNRSLQKQMRFIILGIFALWIIYPAIAQDNINCETAEVIKPSNTTRIYKEGKEWWYTFTPKEKGFYVFEPFEFAEVFMGNCSDMKSIESGYRPVVFYGEKGKTYFFRTGNHFKKIESNNNTWKFYKYESSLRNHKISPIAIDEKAEAFFGYNWYKFEPSSSQEGYYSVKILRDDSYPRQIVVYTGSLNNLKLVASGNSQDLYFYVSPKKTYYIQWHDHIKDYGSNLYIKETQLWQLHKIADFENWICRTALAITPSENIEASDNMYHWYSFTPQKSDAYIIKTNEKQVNGVMYTGTCGNLNFERHLSSSNYLYAETGKTYYFKWRYPIQQGNKWTWSLQQTDGNMFYQKAQEITPSDSAIIIINASDIPSFSQYWFCFVPSEDGYYTAESNHTNTSMNVYVGDCDSLHKISPPKNPSSILFYANRDKTYYISYSNVKKKELQTLLLQKVENLAKLARETAQEITVSSTFVVDERKENWYKLSITEDGFYTTNQWMNIYTDSLLLKLNSSDYPGITGHDRYSFLAQAGKDYYIRWRNNNSTKPHIASIHKETVGSSQFTAITVNPSEKIKTEPNKQIWYSFTPTTEQHYTIHTNHRQRQPTVMCSSSFPSLINNKHFPVFFTASEGKTYYIFWDNIDKEVEWSLQETTENIIRKNAIEITDSDSIKAEYTNNHYCFTPTEGTVYCAEFKKNSKLGLNIFNTTTDKYLRVNYSRDYSEEHAAYFFYAETGRTYTIGMTNSSDTTQFWTLKKIENPEGLACETAQIISLSDSITFTNKYQLRWYVFIPEESGRYEFLQGKTEFSRYTILNVFDCRCGLQNLDSSERRRGGNILSRDLYFDALAGTKYYIYLYNTRHKFEEEIFGDTWSLRLSKKLIE